MWGRMRAVRMSELDRVRRRAWLRGLQEYMQDILDRARKGQCAPAQLPGLPHSGTHNAGRCSGSKMERGEEEDESPGEGAPTVEGLLELWDACKEKYLLFRCTPRSEQLQVFCLLVTDACLAPAATSCPARPIPAV